jgi:hypothetical protein
MEYARRTVLVRGIAAILSLAGCLAAPARLAVAADDETGFESLFDGTSLAGWQAIESPSSFKVAHGAIVAHGPRSHLYYVGPNPAKPVEFTNFHLKAEVMTKPNANSGIFFHTKTQPDGWPVNGYELQVNNTFKHDPVRTGSIYNVVKNFTPPAEDNTWFTLEAVVVGKSVTVKVDGRAIYEFVEPEGVTGTRRFSSGLLALQAHDPGSEVHYRKIRVKRLP